MRPICYLVLALILSIIPVTFARGASTQAFQEMKWPADAFALNDGSGDLWVAAKEGRPIAHHLAKTGWIDYMASDTKYDHTSMFAGTGRDMFMLCRNEGQQAATIYRFTYWGATKFAETTAAMDVSAIAADTSGGVWISGTTRHMQHLNNQGGVDIEYDIPTELVPQSVATGASSRLAPLEAIRDMKGRIWFRGDRMRHNQGDIYFYPLIMWDGHKMEAHGRIKGLPTGWMGDIVSQDASCLWINAGQSLYCVDTDKMEAVPIQPANPQRIERITLVVPSDDGCYVFKVDETSDYDRPFALWRLQLPRDGITQIPIWTCIIDDLGNDSMNIVACRISTGLWIGTEYDGLWWVPDSGSPVHINWQNGLRSDRIYNLVKLPNDRVVAEMQTNLKSHNGTHFLLPQQQVTKLKMDLNVAALNYRELDTSGLQLDSHRHLWTTRFTTSGFLHEWNGTSWNMHLLPYGARGVADGTLCIDSEDRIWCISKKKQEGDTSTVAIFNPKTQSWQEFDSYEDALVAYHLDHNFSLNFGTNWYMSPLLYGKKILYGNYHYFDGSVWRYWEQQDLERSLSNDDTNDSNYLKQPYFNEQGILCIQGNKHDCRWIDNQWQPYPPTYMWQRASDKIYSSLPAPLSGKDFVQYAVPDHDGGEWYISDQGEVYRDWGNAIFTVFGANDPNPVRAFGSDYKIIVDAQRNFWFQRIGGAGGDYIPCSLRIASRGIHTVAHFTTSRNSPDSVTTTISKVVKNDILGWSLDDLPMIRAEKFGKTWRGLSPGVHHIGLYIIDRHGLPSLVQMSTPIMVTTSTTEHIAHLIAAFKGSSDAEREDILASLSKYGKEALPALKAAKKGDHSSADWWIETTIQEINSLHAQ